MTVMTKPLLKIDHLEISCRKAGNTDPLVRDVSFELSRGEMVALTGPSGCGKSLTAYAAAGLLEKSCAVTNGCISYSGHNVTGYTEQDWRRLRREEISLLIQHSLNGLDPIRTVKKQMVETVHQKRKRPIKETLAYLKVLLQQVGFSDPESILSAYPFELSGGMRQRVLLAMMISLETRILIADEPTTALDVINKDRILTLLKKLQLDFGLTILLISHDHDSIHKFADRVIEMKQGGVMA